MKEHVTVLARPKRDHLGLKLAMISAGVFAVVLLLYVVADVLDSYKGRQEAEASIEAQPAPIVIDPKIQAELSKVLALDAVPAVDTVLNPFIDRKSIAGGASALSFVGTQNTTAGAKGATGTAPVSGSASGSGTTSVIRLSGSPVVSPMVRDAKARYQDWIQRQQSGEFVGAESTVLSIDDLVPVGFASGGAGGEEVMLYSLSLCRTFTFGVGTRFYDGWLNGLSSQEVVFALPNGFRRKSFSRPETCADAQVAQSQAQAQTDGARRAAGQ